ncbi:WG repeat-containing protein [Chitinophaga sp. CF418]|uniref:WG repeat-containing protein n=1 Tax=Chitinophaga sp. CF418 TaxID=1855287 RepID=UPI0009238834|nr:WG repeat-containing protein [Chitinophaga sp. CF418]SHN07781.1 WG containing repeat-containing protein [Chitinophaga sp. CF418]
MRQAFYLLLTLLTLQSFAQSRKYPYYNGHKWGLVNDSNQVVVQPKYDSEFWIFREKIAIVQQGGLYGSIGVDGTTIIPCRYDSISIIKGFTVVARLKGKYRLVDVSTGKELSEVGFDKWKESKHDKPAILPVNIDAKWYFMNMVTGQLVNKQGYDEIGFVSTGYYEGVVQQGGKYGVMNLTTGALIAPIQYDHLVYKSQGAFDAIEGDKILSYTADGKSRPGNATTLMQTESVSSAAMSFDAPKPDDSYVGYMSLYVYKGKEKDWKVTYEKRVYANSSVTPTREFQLIGYTNVEMFYYDETKQPKALLKVVQNGKTGLITPEGNVILPCIYDGIRDEGGFYVPQIDGKEGLIKPDSKVLSEPVLKRVYSANYDAEAYFIEMPDGKKGYMDMHNGKIYIPGVSR